MEAESSGLAETDRAMFADPDYQRYWQSMVPEMFAHGVAGYTDDRLADGRGWHDFDVAAIRCPVVVVHGGSDMLIPVANARHTAAIVPGATLCIVDELGHISIVREVVGAVRRMLDGGDR
jgi:pimeloyl-ACP methyl ester carboxylesterase